MAIAVALSTLVPGCTEPPEPVEGNPTTWKLLQWAGEQWGGDKTAKPSTPEAATAPEVLDPDIDAVASTLEEQRERLFAHMKAYFDLSPDAMSAVQGIFQKSSIAGQGNPKVTEHPMKRSECVKIREQAGLSDTNDPAVCGARNMVPLYDVQNGAAPDSAPACIDQFEFPNIPCQYPVVHVTAMEAAELCQAVGKRLCDAHEWEGACAGSLRPPEQEYAFGRSRKDMKNIHNNNREIVWAYGAKKNHALCATASSKSKSCHGGGYRNCGSNTYPAGAFVKCVSSLGVYDLHGNAAEHMNLPIESGQLASLGKYGETEMKGSWFIFSNYEAHDDDCRWRAPDWHATRVMSPSSHSNYHLGFRCCKNTGKSK